MPFVETLFAGWFGKKFLDWLASSAYGVARTRADNAKAKEILRSFLIDNNAEHKLDSYLTKLDELNAENAEVKKVRLVLDRTKVKFKASISLPLPSKKKATKKKAKKVVTGKGRTKKNPRKASRTGSRRRR